MFITIFLGLLLVFLLLTWHYTWKPKNFPSGPPIYPIVGSLFSIIKPNLYELVESWRETYGPIIGFILPGRISYIIADPKLIFDIVNKDELQGRFSSPTIVEFLKSRGIFLNDGLEWQELKRFTLKNLRDYGFNKDNVIEEEFYKWKKHTMSQGNIHCVDNLFSNSSLNIVWETISGKKKSYDDAEFNKLIQTIYDMLRFGTPLGLISDIMPWLNKFIPKLTGYTITYERVNFCVIFIRKEMEEHQKMLDPERPKDFMDSFIIEMKKGNFTEYQIVSSILDLLIAGGESISNTISFTLLYMILYPEVQKKVQNEIDNVIGDTQFSLIEKQRLPYVEATLAEVKRCNTIVPLSVPRRVLKDFVFEGYPFIKDSIVTLNLWSIYQDKKIWGDPKNFRPERFIDESGNLIRDEKLVFFGLGKRKCLGESLAKKMEFIFFVKLMQEFSVNLPAGEPKPSTVPKSGFTYAPATFNIEFTKRK